ncbi:hypothetical protein, partial [Nesterenkonia salmonea]|uniref:hypothetical protein n=1 Tax=Nesterenkonia salmonea TaxID=1804987 RepID=UPI001AA0A5E7
MTALTFRTVMVTRCYTTLWGTTYGHLDLRGNRHHWGFSWLQGLYFATGLLQIILVVGILAAAVRENTAVFTSAPPRVIGQK